MKKIDDIPNFIVEDDESVNLDDKKIKMAYGELRISKIISNFSIRTDLMGLFMSIILVIPLSFFFILSGNRYTEHDYKSRFLLLFVLFTFGIPYIFRLKLLTDFISVLISYSILFFVVNYIVYSKNVNKYSDLLVIDNNEQVLKMKGGPFQEYYIEWRADLSEVDDFRFEGDSLILQIDEETIEIEDFKGKMTLHELVNRI